MAVPHLPRHAPLRRAVKTGLYSAIRLSGGLTLLRWIQRSRVPILCYHSVVDGGIPPWVARGGLHLPVDRFRRQMHFLSRHYRVVSLDEFVESSISGRGRKLPPRSVMITFDDGYANNLNVAAPVLEEFGFPATIFLSTEYVTRGDLFWWDELALVLTRGAGQRITAPEPWRELDLTTTSGMLAALDGRGILGAATLEERREMLDRLSTVIGGNVIDEDVRDRLRPLTWKECRARPRDIAIGGHSASHCILDAITPQLMAHDLAACREALKRELGIETPPVFCYPDGRWTADVQAAVSRAGFAAAVEARPEPREEKLSSGDDHLWAIRRIGVNSSVNLTVYAGCLGGLPGILGKLRGRSWNSREAMH